jgi:hypothetical protein
VKFVRRFCLLLCALGVFLNVTFSNALQARTLNHKGNQTQSKQLSFRKIAQDPQFTAFEFEEDIELDEDGGDFSHTIVWGFSSYQTPSLSFQFLNCKKYSYYSTIIVWNKFPLFIHFQNFRI